jgi:hypothetical protein
LTYAFAREATGFIDANKDKPFFLYLPFNTVHAPLQAPPRLANRFKESRTRSVARSPAC